MAPVITVITIPVNTLTCKTFVLACLANEQGATESRSELQPLFIGRKDRDYYYRCDYFNNMLF
jgi:hypothetical protein